MSPLPNSSITSLDGYTDFSGGINMRGPIQKNQYHYAENLMLNGDKVVTRDGFVRANEPVSTGIQVGFWFNQDAVEFNDATHTGFWFPFKFVVEQFVKVRGVDFIRPEAFADWSAIFVADQTVFLDTNGFVQIVPADGIINDSMDVSFVQANNRIFLFRGDNYQPLWWDGTDDAGFVKVPDYDPLSDSGLSSIPWMQGAVYFHGRLWGWKGRDDVYASDILEFTAWDYVYGRLTVRRGDGTRIVNLVPFHDDYMLVFKENSVAAIVDRTGTRDLNDYIVTDVSDNYGLAAKHAYVIAGERVLYLSSRGIEDLSRNNENRLVGFEVPLSWEIQPIIDRINWDAVGTSSAVAYGNMAIFAVPLDGADTPSHAIVFDHTARGGTGAFISVWKSDESNVFNPLKFLRQEEKLLFFSGDGVIREMFTGHIKDSIHPNYDVPDLEDERGYEAGEVVYLRDAGGDTGVYQALKYTNYFDTSTEQEVYVSPPNTEYWVKVDDPASLFDITTSFISRFIDHGDEYNPKTYGVSHIEFSHIEPSVTVKIEERDPHTLKTVFSNVEYDRKSYEHSLKEDWDVSNDNVDHDTQGRGDYLLKIIDGEIRVSNTIDEGITFHDMERHALKFLPFLVHNRSFAVSVLSSKGRIQLESIIVSAEPTLFTNRER